MFLESYIFWNADLCGRSLLISKHHSLSSHSALKPKRVQFSLPTILFYLKKGEISIPFSKNYVLRAKTKQKTISPLCLERNFGSFRLPYHLKDEEERILGTL